MGNIARLTVRLGVQGTLDHKYHSDHIPSSPRTMATDPLAHRLNCIQQQSHFILR